MIKNIIQSIFHRLGYQVNKLSSLPVRYMERENVFTMSCAIQRLVQRNIEIRTVIDVGASDGRWSELCMRSYPDAFYYLMEAQSPHREALAAFKKQHSKVDFVIAAAGNKVGTVYFDNSGLFGGLASDAPFEGDCIVVPVTTIDEEAHKHRLQAPFLIKLDTHGYEVPILEGARQTLKEANAVIIETYNFQIAKDSLRFWEMCSYMENLGFLPIDMADFMHRKKDGAFWQMDTFFIRKDKPEFQSNDYE